MTQLTLSLYILSLKFPLLYENETSLHGPKNCQKFGVYDKKTWNCWKRQGLRTKFLNQQFGYFGKTFAQMHDKSAMQTARKLAKKFRRPNFLKDMFKQIFFCHCMYNLPPGFLK